VRRRFYELAVGGASPITSEALQRIADLEPWLRESRRAERKTITDTKLYA
jgi:hypothetical protein